MANTQMKSSLIRHQGDVNSKHNEIPLHTQLEPLQLKTISNTEC